MKQAANHASAQYETRWMLESRAAHLHNESTMELWERNVASRSGHEAQAALRQQRARILSEREHLVPEGDAQRKSVNHQMISQQRSQYWPLEQATRDGEHNRHP